MATAHAAAVVTDGAVRLDMVAALALMRARGIDGAIAADLLSGIAAGMAGAV